MIPGGTPKTGRRRLRPLTPRKTGEKKFFSLFFGLSLHFGGLACDSILFGMADIVVDGGGKVAKIYHLMYQKRYLEDQYQLPPR
jgi:hypothetical protein